MCCVGIVLYYAELCCRVELSCVVFTLSCFCEKGRREEGGVEEEEE